jgi:hypothetical protein
MGTRKKKQSQKGDAKMDLQYEWECKVCWGNKLEIYSNEQVKLARTPPVEGNSNWAVVSVMMMSTEQWKQGSPLKWLLNNWIRTSQPTDQLIDSSVITFNQQENFNFLYDSCWVLD